MKHDEEWLERRLEKLFENDQHCCYCSGGISQDSVEEAIESYAEHLNRWRSVSDELPEENETVLLSYRDGVDIRAKAGFLSYENGSHRPPVYYGVAGTNIKYQVTHWKPVDLPEIE